MYKWPPAVINHMMWRQRELEEMRKEAEVRYRQKHPSPCTFCGTLIRCDMYRHVACCHLELAQLWRCLVSWCTVWKGTPQDLMDHVRGAHNMPGEIKVSLETLFHPWTVTCQVYTDSLTSRHSGISNDVLLFSDIGLSLIHHYRVHMRGLPHVAFRRNYMSQLRAVLPPPTVLPIAGGSSDAACSPLPCGAESPDVACASPRPSRRAIGRRRPIRVIESPVRIAPRLTVQDPLGAVVLDCCPPLLPASMNVSGVDLSEIQSSTMAVGADAARPEREQYFGGGDLLSLICLELGVAPLVDPGTDLEDKLSTPAVSPVAADHGVAPLSSQADVDIDLDQVFDDVGSLPAMVTPVCDLHGGLGVTPRSVLCVRLLVCQSLWRYNRW